MLLTRPAPLVSRIVTVAALATVAAGFVIRAVHGGLGTAAPPFVFGWSPRADGAWLAAAVAAGALAVAGLPALARARVPPAVFALATFAASLGLGLAINAARSGTAAWSAIFDLGPRGSFEAVNEYLPGLPTLQYGVRFYLDRFAELVPSQSVNVAGHPPGPLLLVHWLGITTPGALAALCIGAGSLCAPLAHRLAWTLHDERSGRIAGVLCACSPVALLYGVTSYDYAFAAAGALAAALLVARRAGWRAAGIVAFALATQLSWALLAIGAWAALVVWRRDGVRAALALAAGCALAVLALDGALAAAYGYDPIGTLRATEQVYRNSISQQRPYAFWVLGSPVAWGLMLGLPIAAAALRALARADPAALALAVVVLVAAAGGYTKAESERIWLFLVPLACAAAAAWLPRERLRSAVVLLLAQAALVEVLANTVW